MKAVISSDYHIGINPRHKKHTIDLHNSIKYIVDYAIKIKSDCFLILGDMLHRPNISSDDLFFLRDIFQELFINNIKVYCTLGNHDSSKEPVSKVFDTLVTFIDRNNYIKNGLVLDTFLLLPYLYKEDKFPETKGKVLCLHQIIEGSVVNPNITAIPLHGSSRFFTKKEIKENSPSMVFSGDIHHHHSFKIDTIPIHYIGTPSVLNWGETEYKNGFYHFEDGKCKYVTIPQRKWTTLTEPPKEIDKEAVYRLFLSPEHAETYKKIPPEQISSFIMRKNEKPIKYDFSYIELDEISCLRLWLKHKKLGNEEEHIKMHKELT